MLYEAPHRVARTLADLARACGPERPVAVGRELTKLHEEVWRGTLGEAVAWVAAGRAARGVGAGRRRRRTGRSVTAVRCRGRSSALRVRLAAAPTGARPWPTVAAALRRAEAGGVPAGARTRPGPSRPGTRLNRPDQRRRPGTLHRRGPVLRHHAHLLRQRRAPHRPRLHHGHRRRPGPLAPAAGRRRVLPHRHRRARAEGAAGRRSQRSDPPGAGRPDQRPVPGGVGGARHRLRRFHPHLRASPPPGHVGLDAGRLRQRLDRAAPLRGPVLRLLRGLLHRVRAARRHPVPDPRHPGRVAVGGELLLQAVPVHRPAARVVRRQSGCRDSRGQAQRGDRLDQGRSARHLHLAYLDHLGRAGSLGSRPRLLRLVRRPHQLRHRHRLRRPTPNGSPPGGRQFTT